MSEIILDISPNTHLNSNIIIHRMINEIKKIDTHKHEIIFKTQIFRNAPPNLPITPEALNFFGFCSKLAGYKWTASVFDLESLDMLMKYEEEIPFIKVACRKDLYWLIGEIKRKIKVYVSFDGITLPEMEKMQAHDRLLLCIPKYPAEWREYIERANGYTFNNIAMDWNCSDHTVGFELWHRRDIKPAIIEWHYCEKDSTGPDAGPFAKTVDDLKEIL